MDLIQVGLSLIGVLGLIFLLLYAMKKLNKKVSVSSGNRMKILDRVNVGRDGMLLVISVCGQLMLVGVTQQRIEKIADLPGSEEDYTNFDSSGQQEMSFKSALTEVLRGKKDSNNDKE